MNRFVWSSLPVLLLGIAASATASDLTVPNTFTAGTAAVAAEVNANFTAVESAVDDNHGRITTLEGTMPGKVDVSGDTMTGVLTVPSIAYSSPRTHYLAISGDAFRPRVNTVDYSCGYGNGGCRINTTTVERLIVNANLPHGALITGFTAHLYDNDPGNDLDAYIFQQFFSTGYTQIGNTVTSTSASTTTQALTAIVSPARQVNNNTSSIVIFVGPASGSTWTAGSSNLLIRGVTITYTISEAE